MAEARRSSGIRASLAGAFSTPDLRRLQAAWAASAVGGWVFFVALAVYAYDAGGATAVGAAALVRMVPAGFAAPIAGLLADRRSRRDVLLGSLVVRAAVLGVIVAAITAGAPLVLVLVLAALFTIVTTAHKPAQASLLPALAETPRQLAASNAVWSGIDNAAFLVGALLSGALIATTSVEAALAATAVLFALAAVPVAGIARDTVPDYRASGDDADPLRDVAAGFRDVMADRGLRLIVGFLSLSTLIEGATDVLVVIVAIELLDLGGAGVGWLNACWGLGGLIGGGAALAMLGRGRLAAGLGLGGLLVGVPLMLIAVAVEPAVSASMLVLLGVGYALIEIAGLSLLQRLTSDDVLGRAFAVVESSYWVTTGVGAMLAPVVVMALGERGALVAVGACLPVVVLLRWRALARFEAGAKVPERPFRALRSLPLFQPLPIATVENVSRGVAEMQVRAGEVVIREGDPGDRFYIIAEGVLDVSCETGSFPPMADGDYFGEIALLRDRPRTATVTARSDAVLFALERESFLCAIGAHRCAARAASAAIDDRLARTPVA
jgi:MFS family permease